ncbi:ABC-type transport system involved in multi-copper enzyme maturation, permease component [Micromonospora nigra]|uniref:ABC-type transport system involved in multi-copper enzyme maturation, permease component n=1 Tax=Micromonospora nigra TaxID=145857 RepID=A0A1C6SIS8_9ACTN|nr:ABC transporter permease subunit [Micromonospora nigra]SCL29343.1 ABC-type transport system involved in multi-copper enzyme maturation, permease component [Micromonospora nigra]
MNLVRAELERLGARRFVQLMVVLLVLAFGVTTATTVAGSHQPTAAELAAAQRQAADNLRDLEARYERCLARERGALPTAPGEEGGYLPRDCSEVDPALRERLPVATDYLTGVFVFSQEALPLLYFLIAFLVLFGFLVGASYIGADLNSGGVVNLLLWRPRRMTVLGTKLAALLGAVLALSLVASVVYLGTFWTVARATGLPGTLDAAFWSEIGAIWGRGLLVVLLAAATGFAVATLGRHTSAALGAVAAYVVVWELGARLVMEILETARPDQLMLSSYVGAWLAGRVEFWDGRPCVPTSYGSCDLMYELTWPTGLAVLLLLAGGLTTAAFAVFRRRDLM